MCVYVTITLQFGSNLLEGKVSKLTSFQGELSCRKMSPALGFSFSSEEGVGEVIYELVVPLELLKGFDHSLACLKLWEENMKH